MPLRLRSTVCEYYCCEDNAEPPPRAKLCQNLNVYTARVKSQKHLMQHLHSNRESCQTAILQISTFARSRPQPFGAAAGLHLKWAGRFLSGSCQVPVRFLSERFYKFTGSEWLLGLPPCKGDTSCRKTTTDSWSPDQVRDGPSLAKKTGAFWWGQLINTACLDRTRCTSLHRVRS